MNAKEQNAINLARMNAYRVASGMSVQKDFRPARHQQFLDDIVAPWEVMIADEAAEKTAALAKEKGDDAPDPNAHTKAALVKIKDDKAKPLSYKHLARKAPAKSAVGGPVQFVHDFLTFNPELSRKEAIAALVDNGVNFSTARTQYQKWFTAKKAVQS